MGAAATTRVPGPSAQQPAPVAREHALRPGAMGRVGEHEEKLDLAERDALQEHDDAVEEAPTVLQVCTGPGGELAPLQVERSSQTPSAAARRRVLRASGGYVSALSRLLEDDEQSLRELPELFSVTTHAVAIDDAGR